MSSKFIILQLPLLYKIYACSSSCFSELAAKSSSSVSNYFMLYLVLVTFFHQTEYNINKTHSYANFKFCNQELYIPFKLQSEITTQKFFWRKYGIKNHEVSNCILSSTQTEKAMAPHSSTLAWKIPWTEKSGGLQSMGSLRVGHDLDFPFTFHCHALEKEMATHSSVLA